MHAHEHRLPSAHVALHEGDVVLTVGCRPVKVQIKVPKLRRQLDHLDALDQPLALAPVADELFDGAHAQLVPAREPEQLGQARHLAVVAHDLADDADRAAAGELHEVHGRLGVARALQYAARLRAQRKDVARLHEVVRHCGRFGHHPDGASAVGCADARAHASRSVHAHLEIRAKRLAVLRDHPLDAELREPSGCGRNADQPASVNFMGVLGRHDEVALVLAVRVVHHDDHAATPDVGEDGVERVEGNLHARRV